MGINIFPAPSSGVFYGSVSSNSVPAGTTRFNPTSSAIEIFDGTSWRYINKTDSPWVAFAECLLIGGGGSAGVVTNGSGGGGGGGFLEATFDNFSRNKTYNVTIGAGATTASTKGGDTVALNLTAVGGGAGGNPNVVGGTGGSGGGGGGAAGGGSATSGQGFAGGSGSGGPNNAGGGGGGAGGVGENGNSDINAGPNGGAAKSSSITGTSVLYSGGGGGWNYNYGKRGADGGGVYGKGGGATAAQDGVFIMKYSTFFAPLSITTGTVSYTVSGDFRIYQWTTSGSFEV